MNDLVNRRRRGKKIVDMGFVVNWWRGNIVDRFAVKCSVDKKLTGLLYVYREVLDRQEVL